MGCGMGFASIHEAFSDSFRQIPFNWLLPLPLSVVRYRWQIVPHWGEGQSFFLSKQRQSKLFPRLTWWLLSKRRFIIPAILISYLSGREKGGERAIFSGLMRILYLPAKLTVFKQDPLSAQRCRINKRKMPLLYVRRSIALTAQIWLGQSGYCSKTFTQ